MTDIAHILVCPVCHRPVAHGLSTWTCKEHGAVISLREDGIIDALQDSELRHHRPFLHEYNEIRRLEGRIASLDLPVVPENHPFAREWSRRYASMNWLIDRLAVHDALPGGRILDAGAGVCWLSRQLARRGGDVVALDINDDGRDGLTGGRIMLQGGVCFSRVRGSIDNLPFCSGFFDVVVFNGAIHYAEDCNRVISEASRVLRPKGLIAILDSPVYRRVRSGERMLDRRGRGRSGYLTYAQLNALASSENLDLVVEHEPTTLWKRLARLALTIRLLRKPAEMPRILFAKCA